MERVEEIIEELRKSDPELIAAYSSLVILLGQRTKLSIKNLCFILLNCASGGLYTDGYSSDEFLELARRVANRTWSRENDN